MEKDEKIVWSTDDIRAHRSEWSLAADAALFHHVQLFSQNIVSRTRSVLQSVETLGNNLNVTATSISNTSDKFLSLANTQFVENRVYDDEEVTSSDANAGAQAPSSTNEKELSTIIEESFSRGIALVDSKYSEFQLPGSDSEDEDLSSPSRLVLRPHNPYSSRKLPHVIGSSEFFRDDNVGLGSASSSSVSSSSSSLSEDVEEDSLPDTKPYVGRASSSTGSAQSIGSMEESKSVSPADDIFGKYRDSINSVQTQPNESRFSNPQNYPETINQHSKQHTQPSHKDSDFEESDKPSNSDPFSHHLSIAPSLFAPPPFDGEESSEESDNESLFAVRKQNRNRLFIDDDDDDDEDDDDAEDVHNRKQIIGSLEKEVSSRSKPQENEIFNSTVPKSQITQKKIPAGAVSIFGKNMNPFPHVSGPPLFPRDQDSDESEQTQGASSDDGFSVSHKSSSDFASSKPDLLISKAPIKNSLFDDEDDNESDKDFDSLLFQSSPFPNKNMSSLESNKKPLSSLFSNSNEDIFSSSDKTKSSNKSADIFSAPEKQSFKNILRNSEGTDDSKQNMSISNDKTAGSKNVEISEKLEAKTDLFINPTKYYTLEKALSNDLFDSNSDDGLFPAPKLKDSATLSTKSENVPIKRSLFDDVDTVDFSKTSPLIIGKKDQLAKQPFLDLFDDNEDDDSFLFGSNTGKESTISSNQQTEASKKPISLQDDSKREKTVSASKVGNSLSSSDKVLIVDKEISKKSMFRSIFDDDDDSSMFAATKDNENKTETSIMPSVVIKSDISSKNEKGGPRMASNKLSGSLEDNFSEIENKENIFGDNISNNDALNNDMVAEPVETQTLKYGEINFSTEASLSSKAVEDGSGDFKIKPAGNEAMSEIDKLKKKLASSGSDDFSSDDSCANSKPKIPSPGKLAVNRGQNINIAALMPGYKHHSTPKSESSTISSESSIVSSESAPTFIETSSQSTEESAPLDKPVSKSSSMPTSLTINDISRPEEQSNATFSKESSEYSHFLANDALKKRAKLSMKRRPPSQKARQEAAQASLTNNNFSHHHIKNNNEVPQPTKNTNLNTNDSIVQHPRISLDDTESFSQSDKKYENSKNKLTKFTTSENDYPPCIAPNDLFSDNKDESSEFLPEIFGGKNIFAELEKSSSSADVVNENWPSSKTVSSIFDDGPPPYNIEEDEFLSEIAVENPRKKNWTSDLVEDEKLSAIVPTNAEKNLVSSTIFDNSPPSFDIDPDMFSKSTIEKSWKKDLTGDVLQNKYVSSNVPENTQDKTSKEGKNFLVSSIFDESPPHDVDDLFSNSIVTKSEKKDQVEAEKSLPNVPENAKEKDRNVDKISSISSSFNENVTSSCFDSSNFNDDSASEQSKTKVSSSVNDSKTERSSESSLEASVEKPSNASEQFSASSVINKVVSSHSSETPNLFSDSLIKVPNTASSTLATLADEKDDDLFSSSSFKKEVPKKLIVSSSKDAAKSKGITEKKIESDKPTTINSKKSTLTAENPLVDDLSDEDLFGTYSTKPIVSVLNKFKPSSNSKLESSNKPSTLSNQVVSKSESKVDEDSFFNSDNNIEKLFPKVKISAKKSSQIDPLSEVSLNDDDDDDDEDLFDDGVISPIDSEEKQKTDLSSNSLSDKISSKRIESMDDGSLFEDSFKTAPSDPSDLDKVGNLVSPDEVTSISSSSKLDDATDLFVENMHKIKEKSLEHSSIFEKVPATIPRKNFEANTSLLNDTQEDLFSEGSQSYPKVRSTLPSKTISAAKSVKLLPDLFGNDEEDDDLFKSTPNSLLKNSKTSSNLSVQNNLSKNTSPSGSNISSSHKNARSNLLGASKKENQGSFLSQEAAKTRLFDDHDDEEEGGDADSLFSNVPKLSKSKTNVPPSKKSSLPKLNTSIFGDDEDSDTELFTSSLKKK